MGVSFGVVGVCTAAAVLLGWIYFRRYRLSRPPIGVMNLADVAIMVGGIVLVPYLYLLLPSVLVTALLGASIVGILYFVCEPVLRARSAVWIVVVVLAACDLGAWLAFGAGSGPFLAVNDVLVVVAVIGVSNLWAQSGLKARDVAVLAGALTVYDFIFTTQLSLMTDLIGRLAGLPFAPLVAWSAGEGTWLSIGLGDLLLATAFPLVMRKGYGLTAGQVAMVVALALVAALLMLSGTGLMREVFPVMVVLGPLIVCQYAYWRWRYGLERTTREYLLAEPSSA